MPLGRYIMSSAVKDLGSDHGGYNMKSAELFGNGQTKPDVLKESKE
jgi:hypothetical protein